MSSPQPIQWEYLVVEANYDLPSNIFKIPSADQSRGHFKVSHINSRELENWRSGPPYHEYINWLGSQGWELVHAQGGETRWPYISLFKRPRQA